MRNRSKWQLILRRALPVIIACMSVLVYASMSANATINPEGDGDDPTGATVSLVQLDHYQPVGYPAAYVTIFALPGGGQIDVLSSSSTIPQPSVWITANDPLTGAGDTLVSLPDFSDEVTIDSQWAAYQASGRTPEKDRAIMDSLDLYRTTCNPKLVDCTVLAQLPSAGDSTDKIWTAGCLTIDSSVYWSGCYDRYKTTDSDSAHNYSDDGSQGTGHGKGAWRLRTGRTGHSYNDPNTSGEQIVAPWAPASDQPGSGNCPSTTISITAYAATVSRTYPNCPHGLTIKKYDPNVYFRSQFNGCASDQNVANAVATVGQRATGNRSYLKFYVYEYHSWVGDC